jgi:hypothetical protein
MIRLYHFLSERYALEAIRDKRLKSSDFFGANDPFELNALAIEKHDLGLFNGFKKTFVGQGMICLSKTSTCPLLWGHYADNHRGIALGFDIDSEWVHEIEYVETRVSYKELGIVSIRTLSNETIRPYLRMKDKRWSYEQEYRLFTTIDEPDPVSGLYFVDWSQVLNLAEVIVGWRSNLRAEKLRALCQSIGANILIKRVKPSGTKFEMHSTRIRAKLEK